MKRFEPCERFLPGWNYNLVWHPDICYDCEWPEKDHPQKYSCDDCICQEADGVIFGPCANHNGLWHKCVQIAQCDCACHVPPAPVRTGNARINLRPTKKRRPLTLPPAPRVPGHEKDYF